MKIVKISLYSLLLIVMVSSCRKEDALGDVNNIPGLGGDSTGKTAIDTWIYDSMVVPYNIDVKYRWNQFTTDQIDANVVPPREDVVIPVMAAIKRIWLQPYIDETNLIFVNKIAPKFFVLSGSSAAGPDGATVGVAGGGRQINLLQINYFKNKSTVGYVQADTILQRDVFLTVHHEFSHIFDQLKRRPNSFDKITQNDYSADWINITDDDARQKGFVSAYASSVSTEDFAEMISFMLVYGKSDWDNFVAGIYEKDIDGYVIYDPVYDILGNIIGYEPRANAAAQKSLHAKEAAIVSYFQTSWGMDFYSLQTRVRTAIEKEFY